MKIWEDEKQVYIRAAMARNDEEENRALKQRLEAVDWSVLEQIGRKETVSAGRLHHCRRSRSERSQSAEKNFVRLV